MNVLRSTYAAYLTIAFMALSACSGGEGAPDTSTPGTASSLVADAGRDQSVFLGTFVTLNGSKSTNANQTGLSYAWTLTKPAGSNAGLSNPNIANPNMTVDVEGTYTATLVVTDAQNPTAKSSPDTALVVASKTNPPPAANAGDDQSVFVGQVVTLNGSGSSDANKNPMKFNWSFTRVEEGSSAELSDRTTVAPSFVADKQGTYIIQLVVNDGTSDSTPDSVTIIASDKPLPTANAGAAQYVLPSANMQTVTLNGSGSHTNPSINPQNLEYKWVVNSSTPSTLVAKNPLNNDSQPSATLNLEPNITGTVIVQLTVIDKGNPTTDLAKKSASETVVVTVGLIESIEIYQLDSQTLISTCTIASCQQVKMQKNTSIQLKARTSQPTPLNHLWTISPPDKATLGREPSDIANFTPNPEVEGDFTITLEVKDSQNNTHTQSINISVVTGPTIGTISFPQNVVPNTTSQADITIGNVTGTPTCVWSSSSPNIVSITPTPCTATSATADIRATQAGTYAVTLQVQDSIGKDTEQFFFSANTAPAVSISPRSKNQGLCSAISLTGTASDVDGDGLGTPAWSITTPSDSKVKESQLTIMGLTTSIGNNKVNNQAQFNGTTSLPESTHSFMPDVKGSYTVTFSVTETKSGGLTSKDSITITGQDTYTLGRRIENPDDPNSLSIPIILDTYNSSGLCGTCHSLSNWGDTTTSSGAPPLQGKGLHVTHKLSGGGNNTTSHPYVLTESQKHDLCVLYNDTTGRTQQ